MTFRKHRAISTEILTFVPTRLEDALRRASANLTRASVRHAICGGLAVGAYGHVRATKDVDFLTGAEAFVDTNGVLTFAPGVPFAIGGVPTDMVPIPGPLSFLEKELEAPYDLDGLPIVSPEALVVLKLYAFRRRDQDDIISIVEAGATSYNKVARYLCEGVKDNEVLGGLSMNLAELEDDRAF